MASLVACCWGCAHKSCCANSDLFPLFQFCAPTVWGCMCLKNVGQDVFILLENSGQQSSVLLSCCNFSQMQSVEVAACQQREILAAAVRRGWAERQLMEGIKEEQSPSGRAQWGRRYKVSVYMAGNGSLLSLKAQLLLDYVWLLKQFWSPVLTSCSSHHSGGSAGSSSCWSLFWL